MAGTWRWLGWLLLFGVWTGSLLNPAPARFNREHIAPHTDLPISKVVHVAVYALLTATAAWLPMPRGRRWPLLLLLSLHGMLTEYLQTFIPLRTGSWQDVLLDHIGIALGLLLAVRWWFPVSAGTPPGNPIPDPALGRTMTESDPA